MRISTITIVLCAALCPSLSGCGGKEEAETKNDEQAVVATHSDSEVAAWLHHTDPMDTGRWLASKEAGRLVPNDDAASAQMRRSLGRAQSFFIEDQRMIANRTVQLGQMLDGAGKPERYEALLEGLTRVAQGGRGKQLYGELCQHYYNTRQQGADRKTALAKLSERYGTQRDGRQSDDRSDETAERKPATAEPGPETAEPKP